MNVDRLPAFSFAEFLSTVFQGAILNIWRCPSFNISSERLAFAPGVAEQTLIKIVFYELSSQGKYQILF
ncbi:hypothetical protein GCWU000341_00969 [Oribacterium sp. oral taxon 078 str. F0262]|nr:hypothetical protein GCWU000341_00969 [Oribacterium sp. oral taxon 078 str. F0262]